jgi:tetratricopeptide (TPR) repeat protein
VLLLSTGAVAAIGCHRDAEAHRAPPPAAAAIPLRTEPEIRDLDLAYFQRRAERDPTGAMDLAHVAALYLARSRDTGDPRDAVAAEVASRRSLRNRGTRNEQARQVLASSLLAQHRFVEALAIARRLRDESPGNASLTAMVGEIEMELGEYDAARASFAALHAPLGDLSVTPRLSRWAEIEGQPARALTLQRAALAVALREPSVSREQVAWFWLRVGDIQLRMGQPGAADSAYASGLALHPGDHRLLAALARSAALQGRWHDAIARGEDAIAANLDPATLGILSDAYAATGDTVRSAEYARTLEVVVLKQPGAYHRAWSLFLLDHDRHISTVHRKVRQELRSRRDVYGYDLLAWSLHKQGRDAEAATAMAHALAQRTQDAMLFYHAGMIALALDDREAARTHLARALEVNPFFQIREPATARAALAALSRLNESSPSDATGAGR